MGTTFTCRQRLREVSGDLWISSVVGVKPVDKIPQAAQERTQARRPDDRTPEQPDRLCSASADDIASRARATRACMHRESVRAVVCSRLPAVALVIMR